MRRFPVIATLVGAAVFAVVGWANPGSETVTQAQVPAKVKTLDADAVARGSRFKLLYHFHDVNVAPGETDGGAIRCRKGWHPVSGLFSSDSEGVLAARDAPVSVRKWQVFVFNQGTTEARVTIGAVCEKGLRIPG